jgi:hypothetical protein
MLHQLPSLSAAGAGLGPLTLAAFAILTALSIGVATRMSHMQPCRLRPRRRRSRDS